MPGRDRLLLWLALPSLAVLLLLAGDAMAYVGPDPAMLGSILAMVGWVVVACASVLLWPVYAVLRRFRRRNAAESSPPPAEALTEAAPVQPAPASADHADAQTPSRG